MREELPGKWRGRVGVGWGLGWTGVAGGVAGWAAFINGQDQADEPRTVTSASPPLKRLLPLKMTSQQDKLDVSLKCLPVLGLFGEMAGL